MSEGLLTRGEFFLAAGAAAGAVAASHPAARHVRQRVRHRRPHRRRHTAQSPLHQIEHVVFLIQENRSFDSYFGTLAGVRGFSDPAAPTLPSGRSVFQQPYPLSPTGALLPWHLDTTRSSPCAIPVDNSWAPSHAAWDGGRMDGFAQTGLGLAGYPMSYYTRADLPWHCALADAFTVCDGYHASVLGPTNPNRLYTMTGTIDPAGRNGGPVKDNTDGPFSWTTYPERLQRAGVSWRVYQQSDNFDDNPLAWFPVYQRAPAGSPLYENGMRRRDAGAFAADVATGVLPAVSWIVAPTAQSEHPGNSAGQGAEFCDSILQALFAHPGVWAKTVLFVIYDEPGGFFDHVVPPTPPPGTPGEFVDGLPIGLGFRVPSIVCSPFSRGGYVNSATFDHTSTLRFLERRFGVVEPQISAWRRTTCGNLIDCLDLANPDMTTPTLPATVPLAAAAQRACQQDLPGIPPLLAQQMPSQEPGSRPRRGTG